MKLTFRALLPHQLAAQAAIKEGVNVFSWHEFLEAGRAKLAEPVPPGPDDLCTVMYTSGTTGVPKARAFRLGFRTWPRSWCSPAGLRVLV